MELNEMTVKQLLEVAKELKITGRHDMKKKDLIDAISAKRAENIVTETTESVVAIVEEPVAAKVEVAIVSGGRKRMSFEDKIAETIERNAAKPKKRYEDNAEIGMLVAFHVNEDTMFSGKIIEIHANKFRIETKRGVKYLVDKSAVAWYKTGQRWPRGIYEELTKRRRSNVNAG